jgi:hypothetical protein
LTGDDYAPFPSSPLRLDRRTGAVRLPEDPEYIVVAGDRYDLALAGRTIRRSVAGLELVRPSRPYRTVWMSSGLARAGWMLPDRPVRITAFPARARRDPRMLVVTLQASVDQKGALAYELRGPSGAAAGAVRARRPRDAALCLPPGRTTAKLTVRGSTSLREASDLSMRPNRLVGLRVSRIELLEGHRRCGG